MASPAAAFDWHIIDPGLGAAPNGGHHISYNQCIASELEAEGAAITLYGHQAAAPADGLESRYLRTFTRSQYQWEGLTLRRWMRTLFVHFRQLRSVTTRSTKPQLFFFHSTTLSQLLPTLAWAHARRGRHPRDLVVILLRYRFGYPYHRSGRRTRLCARICRYLLKLPRVRNRVRFVTDSAALVADHEVALDCRVACVPIPHSPNARPRAHPQPVTIGFVGASRREKGYDLLPGIVREIISRGHQARLVIQSQMDSAGPAGHPDPIIRQAYADLCALAHEYGFQHITHTLGQAAFEELIRSLDIVVFPHRSDGYQAQTSGVFSDAIAAGCIPVVTRDTWLAAQLDEIPFALRPVVDFSPSAIATSALAIAEDIDSFRTAFASLSQRWQRLNTAPEVIRQIMALPQSDDRVL